MQVLVRDNNVDQALKVLKKKMQREGVFREMKLPFFRGGCRLPKRS
jgi:small subunit ribosomal protein S21